MATYRLSPRAIEDLQEITDYLTPDHPAAARRLVDQIEERCLALAKMPEMGRTREELKPGLRSSVVRRYVVFYYVMEDGIEVARIIHGARDIPKQFD